MTPEQKVDQIIRNAAQLEPPADATNQPTPDLSVGLDESRLQFMLECLDSQLRQLNDNHSLRLSYTGKIFWLVVGWLVSVVVCVAMSGLSKWGFKLSDGVMIAFITSTTVNVIGLFVLVAKWMYPAPEAQESAEALRKKARDLKGSF